MGVVSSHQLLSSCGRIDRKRIEAGEKKGIAAGEKKGIAAGEKKREQESEKEGSGKSVLFIVSVVLSLAQPLLVTAHHRRFRGFRMRPGVCCGASAVDDNHHVFPSMIMFLIT